MLTFRLRSRILDNDLRQVDVSQCPQDFRLAWINLIHTIENYQLGRDVAHGLASGMAGALAIKSGSPLAGDLAARQFEEITTQSDVNLALQSLETACFKYGVEPSKPKPSTL